MKNHKKRSGSQSLEDWGKELTLKYQAENLDTAKVSSRRRPPSLHRCAISLTLGVLALIGSIGIGLIPGLHPTLSPAVAFAVEPPSVGDPVCAYCGRNLRGSGKGCKMCSATTSTPTTIQPKFKSKSTSLSPGRSMALGLFQSLLSEALNSDEADNSQAAAQEAAKRAELDAWMKAEYQRLNNMVNQQRVTRDGEDKAGMDEMAKAMGSGFDTPMPKSDLASALSDPNVVDLRGKKGIVDPNVLKQSDPDKPLYVKNLKQDENSGGTPFFGSGGGSNNLQEMCKENHNPKVLDQRLQKLEGDLAEALRQAKDLQNKSEALTTDYALYEKSVDSVTRNTLMRGLSLLVDLSGARLMERLKDLRDNPDKWNRTLQAMDKINKVAMGTNKGMQYGLQSKDVYDYEWDKFTNPKVDLKKDVDFILQNIPADIFGTLAPHYKFGKFMVNASADTIKLFVDLKELDVTNKAYSVKHKEIEIKIKSLVKSIKEYRQQHLASKPDVSRD